jgi:arylamine N-acetyltransferase
MIFLRDEIVNIKKNNTDMSGLEIRKLASKRWSKIKDAEESKKYFDDASREKIEYEKNVNKMDCENKVIIKKPQPDYQMTLSNKKLNKGSGKKMKNQNNIEEAVDHKNK